MVEDEPGLRELAERVLGAVGYKVLSACNGDEALALLEADKGGTVQMIVTDVVMPGMSGPELVERAKLCRPLVKVLFTSGYTDDLIAHHGVLKRGVDFIQKPYTITELTQKVREVLDSAE